MSSRKFPHLPVFFFGNRKSKRREMDDTGCWRVEGDGEIEDAGRLKIAEKLKRSTGATRQKAFSMKVSLDSRARATSRPSRPSC